ncbi:MAG: redoxin domain-containing protein [Acidobacteria bacterium]|nr:redoxin domain-containing protein [Acidobacteriota bacterium]
MALLQPKLDEITTNTRKLVQPERLAVSERVIAELLASNIEQRMLPVGTKAPEFALPDAISGKMIRSSDLLALGPLVVDFFRGRWDPYCVTELETWRDLNPMVREKGGLLVAVSPQSVRQSDFTVQQHGIPFPVLCDEGCLVAEQFGIAYPVSEDMRRYYFSILVNIPFIHTGRNALAAKRGGGDEREWMLPLPATFVMAQDGTIAFADAHADFRVRPEPDEVLAVLERLKS